MGYWATRAIDRLGTKMVKRFERHRDHLPDGIARFALASTAGVEHLTAVLGAQVLSTPWVQQQLTDPEVRAMLNWHAVETRSTRLRVAVGRSRRRAAMHWVRRPPRRLATRVAQAISSRRPCHSPGPAPCREQVGMRTRRVGRSHVLSPLGLLCGRSNPRIPARHLPDRRPGCWIGFCRTSGLACSPTTRCTIRD